MRCLGFPGLCSASCRKGSGSLLARRRAVVAQTNFRQDGTLRLRERGAGQPWHAVGNPLRLSETLGRRAPPLFGQPAGRTDCRGACRLADAAQSEPDARSKPPQRIRLASHVLFVLQRHHRLLGAAKIANIDFNHRKFLHAVGLNMAEDMPLQVYIII